MVGVKKVVHLTGIKGVGMTPIALILQKAGLKVTGSDIDSSYITDEILAEKNIKVYSSFSESNIGNPSVLITTGAHGGLNNVEAVAAKSRGIPVWTQGEAVGKLMEGSLISDKPYFGISVSGTHGKTTTTAMLATALFDLKADPTYIVGTSKIKPLDLPGGFGTGKFFVSEADEYANIPNIDKTAKFLFQNPQILIITSIGFDHPDVYKNLDEIYEVFNRFINKLEEGSIVIINSDQVDTERLNFPDKKITLIKYGFGKYNEYIITRCFVSLDQTFFWVRSRSRDLGEFRINISGRHNSLNALSVIITLISLGYDLSKIKQAMQKYLGSKRRLEKIGNSRSGQLIYDDYAHHPDEISATLNTLRSMYPNNKIAVIFQPHTYSRTERLLKEFSLSFRDADYVVLTDIFASAREQDKNISSKDLLDLLIKNKPDSKYAENFEDVIKIIKSLNLNEEDIVVTMGAGDIYKLNTKLKKI